MTVQLKPLTVSSSCVIAAFNLVARCGADMVGGRWWRLLRKTGKRGVRMSNVIKKLGYDGNCEATQNEVKLIKCDSKVFHELNG